MFKLIDDNLQEPLINFDLWIQNNAKHLAVDEQQQIVQAYNFILNNCEQKNERIGDLYDFCINIAKIVINLKLDLTSIIAALLYAPMKYAALNITTITNNFNADVKKILTGLNEIDIIQENTLKISGNARILAETFHNLLNMLLSIVDDVRIILVKLSTHTYELRYAIFLEDSFRYTLSLFTRELYAPLANRLGIWQIKWELEDLCFRYLEPLKYSEISQLINEKRLDRELYIKDIIQQVKELLQKHHIEAAVFGRIKHIYSIWRKMQRKHISYEQVYDVRAIRIITNNTNDCFTVLGIIHNVWEYINKEFDDYITYPKPNGYRSLHTAVWGPEHKVLEIQIRTQEMHQQAEIGIAAHWIYKENAIFAEKYQKKLTSLRQIIGIENNSHDDPITQANILPNLFDDKVYVFTPNWDVIELPKGATVLDFAYYIHSDIGNRCRIAKVNGSIVSLNHVLSSGSMVEIIINKNGKPSRDWLNPHLNYIKTVRARTKIHSWFRKQDREQNIIDGQEIIIKRFKSLGFDIVKDLPQILARMPQYKTNEDLFAAIGGGDVRFSEVLNIWQALKKPNLTIIKNKKPPTPMNVKIDGINNLLWHIAQCCNPHIMDDIIGYITVGEGVAIHKKNCINITKLTQKSRLVNVSLSNVNNLYEVLLKIAAYNRRHLLRDISNVITNCDADMLSIKSNTDQNNIITFSINIELSGISMLNKILINLQQLHGVLEVYRVTE